MPPPILSTFPGLTLPITRTPIWATLDQVMLSGANVPQEPWTYPRYRYKIAFDFLRQATAYQEVQTLMGFFNSVGGKYGVWQYLDPQDNGSTATAQTIGIGDGTSTAFQLVRTRGSFVEPVFAASTARIIVAGSTLAPSSDYTIDTKGVVSFTTAPAAGSTVAWTGNFRWYCRFDNDSYDFEQFTIYADAKGPLWSLGDLSFTTVKFGA